MKFFVFVRKEFYHIFRDKRTILILLVMPIVQIILFGFAITTEVKNVRMAIYDPSKDISTQRIIHQLQTSEYFTLVEELQNPADIQRIFKEGKANLVIVFGDEFENNLLHTGEASVQLIIDATDPNQATTLAHYALNIITSYGQELIQDYQTPLKIIPEIKMLYNPQMKGAYNFVPGVMGLILMLICAMMTSIAIVREKEMGTMEVLLASPVKPIYIIVSKVTPYLALSIINLATILLLSVHVLNVPIAGSLFLLIAVSFLFISVSLSIGLLISITVDTQVAAMLLSGMGLLLPTMLLSGMIFPVESMPEILQWLSSIVPARWYIDAVRKIMIQGVDTVFVAKELIILSGMTFFLLFISLKKFNIRLKISK
jgi:ABC-2 type transport system permease protein